MNKLVFICILLLASCTSKDQLAKLKAENDSLKRELANSKEMLFTFKEVGSLIDSIDENRNALRVNIVEGTPYFSYIERLKEINNYVDRSEKKIKDLESKLITYNVQSEAYQMLVAALKDELTIAIDEVKAMEHRVNLTLKESNGANQTIKLQQVSLEDFQLQLDAKYEEVKLFELHIQELTNKLQITEADAFFAQAQALELAARRTKLAPRKKKETYQQALELYRKASQAGNPQALGRITELQKRF